MKSIINFYFRIVKFFKYYNKIRLDKALEISYKEIRTLQEIEKTRGLNGLPLSFLDDYFYYDLVGRKIKLISPFKKSIESFYRRTGPLSRFDYLSIWIKQKELNKYIKLKKAEDDILYGKKIGSHNEDIKNDKSKEENSFSRFYCNLFFKK